MSGPWTNRLAVRFARGILVSLPIALSGCGAAGPHPHPDIGLEAAQGGSMNGDVVFPRLSLRLELDQDAYMEGDPVYALVCVSNQDTVGFRDLADMEPTGHFLGLDIQSGVRQLRRRIDSEIGYSLEGLELEPGGCACEVVKVSYVYGAKPRRLGPRSASAWAVPRDGPFCRSARIFRAISGLGAERYGDLPRGSAHSAGRECDAGFPASGHGGAPFDRSSARDRAIHP